MFVVGVNVFVKQEHVNDFKRAVLENAHSTRQEPGNARFDVLQCRDDPTRFMLYEVYYSEEDFKRHQKTEHYLKWREAVADWMAKPREGIKFDSLFPPSEDW
jgi:autoinducer 2-degrading protein